MDEAADILALVSLTAAFLLPQAGIREDEGFGHVRTLMYGAPTMKKRETPSAGIPLGQRS